MYYVTGIPAVGINETQSSKFQPSILEIYPNPFSRFTAINYRIPIKSKTCLKIYDISGKEIKTLVNEPQKSGVYTANCDMRELSAGIYFAKFEAGVYKETKKLILVK